MFREVRPVWAEINLDHVAHNMSEIRRVAKSRDVMAIVKADGYGHGAIDIVPTLLENGATRLGVAVITEAVELRKAGIECPVMILGFTPLTLAEDLLEYDIEQTVYCYEFAEGLSEIAKRKNKCAKIHIALDTGMGRIGFLPNEESIEEVYKISKLSNIIIEGLFSHFSSADEEDKSYTQGQYDKYIWFYNKLLEKGVDIRFKHIGNSAAIIDLPQVHMDAVRPGIILYGYYPSNEVLKEKIDLKPVMTLKANIVHIKRLPIGEYISYGRKFRTYRESMIATLPIGYADGYTRLLFNKAKIILNGKLFPVIGRICMDQCMIDITDMPEVKVGDEAILLGQTDDVKFNADNWAELLGTINYEVLCMISKRIPRVYVKGGEIVKIRNYV